MTTTISVTLENIGPSAHYPPEELVRNRATDYLVRFSVRNQKLHMGGYAASGEITLYRDHDGRMTACGTPIDVWCSAAVRRVLDSMTEAQSERVLDALADGRDCILEIEDDDASDGDVA